MLHDLFMFCQDLQAQAPYMHFPFTSCFVGCLERGFGDLCKEVGPTALSLCCAPFTISSHPMPGPTTLHQVSVL